MKVRSRIGYLLAATSVFAAGTLTAVAPAANAETLSFEYLHKGVGETYEQWLIVAYHNGDYAGEVIWNKDPWDLTRNRGRFRAFFAYVGRR
ncbi:hypothetical protein ABT299_22815 [Spirillospora sp. NPDC000708]|uniref:hypothetical protein n=1 Tax=Actinomadura nitritigenes TaxID=134602 RepID=UPI003345BEDA